MRTTLAKLCETLEKHGLKPALRGRSDREIVGVATLEDAREGELSFLSNPRYEKQLQGTRASAVVLKPGVKAPDAIDLIQIGDPYAAITILIVEYYGYRRHRRVPPEPAHTRIAPSAQIGENATIYPGVTIEDDVLIGANAVLYPGCYVGPRCRIGDDALLYPNVVLYEDTVLGHRVTIHSGTVVGNDGLGYAPYKGKWVKIPQIGIVEIGDDVEIGSNCSIDRATLGKTRIGAGSKLSNLIAIGHGTQIGENCMLVAQVGVAGSVHVGDHVVMAGQAGVVGHVQIGDHATIAAKAGVVNNVAPGETMLGAPAKPIQEMKRQFAYLGRLPQMNQTIRRLEKKIAKLEAKLDGSSGEDPDPPDAPNENGEPE